MSGPAFERRRVVPFAIASGASLSGGINLADLIPSVILMPAAWDAAAITAQISPDGTNWWNLYDTATELSLTVAVDRAQVLTASLFAAAPGPWWRLRSGTLASPVTQTAARTLIVICRPLP